MRKEFYSKFLYQRYEDILQPAYENQKRMIESSRVRKIEAPEP